jgi:hypothetical protein
MNMNHHKGPLHFIAPTLYSMPSAHHKTAKKKRNFSPHEVFFFLKSKGEKKQKMLEANGGPTISPHNPLWCSLAIDQILSPLHMQAKKKEGRKSQAVCEEMKKR